MDNEIETIIFDLGNYASNENPRRDEHNTIIPFSLHYTDANLLFSYICELEEENKKLKELNVCVGCDNNTDYKSRNEKALEVINGYFTEGFDDEYDMLNNIQDKLKGE